MREEALKKLLDRDEPKGQIEEHFKETIELIQEIVNYGTNLIPRAYRTSKRDLPDAIILGGFLKHAVAMLDAVEILVSQGAVLAAQLPARSLFETSWYIAWILSEDTKRRAKQYYVSTLRQARIWASRFIPGTEENREFQRVFEELPVPFPPDMQQQAQAQVNEINRLLAKSEYRPINEEFEKIKLLSKRKSYEPPWYRPWGVNSIGEMASRLNRISEYKAFYSQMSEVSHSGAFKKHVRFEPGILTFEPIRYLEGIKIVVNVSIAITIKIYRNVLDHYRPDELRGFARKYMEEWRERYSSIKDVTYKTVQEDPI